MFYHVLTVYPRCPSCAVHMEDLERSIEICIYIYIYKYIWAHYDISLTWIKAIWGWFSLLTNNSKWGRNEGVIICPCIYIYYVCMYVCMYVCIEMSKCGFNRTKAGYLGQVKKKHTQHNMYLCSTLIPTPNVNLPTTCPSRTSGQVFSPASKTQGPFTNSLSGSKIR